MESEHENRSFPQYSDAVGKFFETPIERIPCKSNAKNDDKRSDNNRLRPCLAALTLVILCRQRRVGPFVIGPAQKKMRGGGPRLRTKIAMRKKRILLKVGVVGMGVWRLAEPSSLPLPTSGIGCNAVPDSIFRS